MSLLPVRVRLLNPSSTCMAPLHKETNVPAPLGDRRDGVVGRAHLSEYFIQPLKWAVEVNLNPAGGTCYILTMILCTPALNKAHPDSAHFCQFIHRLETMVYRLGQQLSKLLVVEDLQAASAGYFTDSCWMESMMIVAVATLNKNAAVT